MIATGLRKCSFNNIKFLQHPYYINIYIQYNIFTIFNVVITLQQL